MLRIVKAGAEIKQHRSHVTGIWVSECYFKSDTVEIKLGWRPEDIVAQCESECPESATYRDGNCDDSDCSLQACSFAKGFYAGFDAAIKALEELK
jgi:hypothetical protein